MSTRKLRQWTAVLFLVLLINTAYIAAFNSPTIFYMGNVLLHLGEVFLMRRCRRHRRMLRECRGRRAREDDREADEQTKVCWHIPMLKLGVDSSVKTAYHKPWVTLSGLATWPARRA